MVRWHQGNTSGEISLERLKEEVMGENLERAAQAQTHPFPKEELNPQTTDETSNVKRML